MKGNDSFKEKSSRKFLRTENYEFPDLKGLLVTNLMELKLHEGTPW
jgi:hypothetical protein